MSPPSRLDAPPVLTHLLSETGESTRERAWAEFVAAHSAIVLHTCRTLEHDHDAAMDGYAYVLGALHEDDCRRLRAYTPNGRTRFTTWLVVVVRRLLLDHRRRRYGRSRSERDTRRVDHAVRRRLEQLVAAELDVEAIAGGPGDRPDEQIRRQELTEALRSALDELAPSDRLLLALRFEDERPVREIAALLGMPTVFHVYRRVGAVLATLKRALARRGVHEPEP